VLALGEREAQRLQRELADLRSQVQSERALAERERDLAGAARRRLEALEARLDGIENRIDSFGPVGGPAGAAEIARARDEVLLLEIERLVSYANQELQLAGSVPAALAALQAADARASRLQRPQPALRRALAADLERLRLLPTVDSAGVALRLDQIAQGLDGWILLADPTQRLASAEPARATERGPRAAADGKPRAGGGAPAATAADPGARVRAWVSAEFGDLVRIRQAATPESLLLEPAQAALVRERLRVRLLTARQAVLARNERLFRPELAESLALTERYFDVRQPAVAAAVAQLRQLGATAVAFEPPASLDTVAALRALTGATR